MDKEYQIEIMCEDIVNDKIRENVVNYLQNEVHEKFWTHHASRNHHRPDERGEGGLVLHTNRVRELVMILGQAERVSEHEMDLLIAGAVVHDTQKYDRNGYRVDHADLVKGSSLLPEIIEIAKMHMGIWYRPERWENVCKLGRLLYYADFLASRKDIKRIFS